MVPGRESRREEREMKRIPGFCRNHKPMSETLGYIAHMDWMAKQEKRGLRQRQCRKCRRWLYQSEWERSGAKGKEGSRG